MNEKKVQRELDELMGFHGSRDSKNLMKGEKRR